MALLLVSPPVDGRTRLPFGRISGKVGRRFWPIKIVLVWRRSVSTYPKHPARDRLAIAIPRLTIITDTHMDVVVSRKIVIIEEARDTCEQLWVIGPVSISIPSHVTGAKPLERLFRFSKCTLPRFKRLTRFKNVAA